VVGLSDGTTGIVDYTASPNFYAISRTYSGNYYYHCHLSGKQHKLEYPTGEFNGGAVVGCGLLLNSKNELAIFFSWNGRPLGKLIVPHN
jgi:hypothetical protein